MNWLKILLYSLTSTFKVAPEEQHKVCCLPVSQHIVYKNCILSSYYTYTKCITGV